MVYLNAVWHTWRSITLGRRSSGKARCQRRNATESGALPIIWWREDASWAPRNATTARAGSNANDQCTWLAYGNDSGFPDESTFHNASKALILSIIRHTIRYGAWGV